MSTISRFKVVGLLGIPVIALVMALLVLTWGNSSSQTPTAEAVAGPGTLSIDIVADENGGGPKTCIDPLDTAICVQNGNDFDVHIVAKAPAAGYITVQSFLDYDSTKINYTKGTFNAGGGNLAAKDEEITWPDCAAVNLRSQGVNGANSTVSHSCTSGLVPPLPTSNFSGVVFDLNFSCKTGDSVSTLTLLPLNDVVAVGDGAGFVDPASAQIPASDSVTIHCQVPPTPTVTQTPTDTPTATPTNTAVSQPPFVKSPGLQNLWLTRQGAKIPPVQCVGPQGGNDTAEFSMDLGVPIAQLDPKGSGKPANLGAFEFEVNYDPNKICVEIQGGQAANTMTCFIEDSVTKPTLEGTARIGCVTIGKKLDIDGIWNAELTSIAGPASCSLLIQEAPNDLAASGIFGKGSVVATDPTGTGVNCTGATPAFGFIVTAPIVGLPDDFNNQTGDMVAIIPCNPPNLGTLCTADGNVTGTFSQDPSTLDLRFDGTFLINVGPAIVPPAGLLLDGPITMTRKTKLAENLATVVVRPQPEVYSQAIPNQDNGVVVQLSNKKCEIADDQGHPIPHFSCDDADVTIRFLEGDVEPDCSVGTLDAQAIAFRWGATKGSLLYLPRFNLEPWGTQSDADIDIKDLQFVYGRFGSTCADPHPVQDPVNPKA